MIKFSTTMNTGIVCLLFLGSSALVFSKDHASSDKTSLKILSYNIKHGRGMDGKVDLPRIAKVVRSLSPDLVALQEIDRNCTRSGSIDLTAELGAMLGMEGRFGKFMDYQGGEYGLAVLSVLPKNPKMTKIFA